MDNNSGELLNSWCAHSSMSWKSHQLTNACKLHLFCSLQTWNKRATLTKKPTKDHNTCPCLSNSIWSYISKCWNRAVPLSLSHGLSNCIGYRTLSQLKLVKQMSFARLRDWRGWISFRSYQSIATFFENLTFRPLGLIDDISLRKSRNVIFWMLARPAESKDLLFAISLHIFDVFPVYMSGAPGSPGAWGTCPRGLGAPRSSGPWGTCPKELGTQSPLS